MVLIFKKGEGGVLNAQIYPPQALQVSWDLVHDGSSVKDAPRAPEHDPRHVRGIVSSWPETGTTGLP